MHMSSDTLMLGEVKLPDIPPGPTEIEPLPGVMLALGAPGIVGT
ncbi:MAG: hypothetical protein AMXMBFR47_27490 [Planctomycetota bacterium]